jgi:hypothetical protein
MILGLSYYEVQSTTYYTAIISIITLTLREESMFVLSTHTLSDVTALKPPLTDFWLCVIKVETMHTLVVSCTVIISCC